MWSPMKSPIANIDPDYRSADKWLRDFGAELHAYGETPPDEMAA